MAILKDGDVFDSLGIIVAFQCVTCLGAGEEYKKLPLRPTAIPCGGPPGLMTTKYVENFLEGMASCSHCAGKGFHWLKPS